MGTRRHKVLRIRRRDLKVRQVKNPWTAVSIAISNALATLQTIALITKESIHG